MVTKVTNLKPILKHFGKGVGENLTPFSVCFACFYRESR